MVTLKLPAESVLHLADCEMAFSVKTFDFQKMLGQYTGSHITLEIRQH